MYVLCFPKSHRKPALPIVSHQAAIADAHSALRPEKAHILCIAAGFGKEGLICFILIIITFTQFLHYMSHAIVAEILLLLADSSQNISCANRH